MSKEYKMNYRARKRQQLINLLGNKCVYYIKRDGILPSGICGDIYPYFSSDWRFLQFDHINGKGLEIVSSKFNLHNGGSNTSFFSYYLKRPEEAKTTLQLLCANHNVLKRHDNYEFRV